MQFQQFTFYAFKMEEMRRILILLLVGYFACLTGLDAAPKLEVRQSLEQTSVISGKELNGTLHLKNSGDETLKIRGVSSSCGCTTIRLKQRTILQNEEIQLRFVVDTRGKLGLVEKTIILHTNALDSPHTETLHFHALPSKISGNAIQAVFEPPCAECHLDSGTGKAGKVLYSAVCAMCHPDETLLTKQPNILQDMIFSGNFTIGMPAYGEFLSKQQIQSLTQFISTKTTP